MKLYTFQGIAEDSPTVLPKIVSICCRRDVRVKEVRFDDNEGRDTANFIFKVQMGEGVSVEKVENQIRKIVEVREIKTVAL